MGDKIRADFFNPPIAELPLHYVRDWYFAAYDTGGVPRETWVYLLPRILEILASGEDIAAVGLEVSLERFDTGNAEKWSAREWQILDAFQRRYLRRNIEEGKDPLDDVLCMFALAGWPVPALLEQVAATPDEVLARKLWRDWCDGRVPGRESIWITAFWKSPGNSTVFDFYASPILRDRMEALTLDETTAADLVAKASAVVQVIEANTASGGC
ncbi:hypothetical protein sos41_41530 [Alphaproteobacteria bacterium SO-S41]|nr:hypothetical protein sos41_41530 [Alphaproteobacteria bacterium SO-S41]